MSTVRCSSASILDGTLTGKLFAPAQRSVKVSRYVNGACYLCIGPVSHVVRHLVCVHGMEGTLRPAPVCGCAQHFYPTLQSNELFQVSQSPVSTRTGVCFPSATLSFRSCATTMTLHAPRTAIKTQCIPPLPVVQPTSVAPVVALQAASAKCRSLCALKELLRILSGGRVQVAPPRTRRRQQSLSYQILPVAEIATLAIFLRRSTELATLEGGHWLGSAITEPFVTHGA
jgi:hypothetical protein